MTDLESVRPPQVNEEKVMLIDFLNYYRESLYAKADGLTDEQARLTSVDPSDLSLMGLIRHMADVERSWFARTLAGNDSPPIYYSKEPGGDIDGDFHPQDTDTLEEAVSTWRNEIAISDSVIAQHQLDEVVHTNRPEEHPDYMMRWIMIHMIEEYARHCGHADLIRENRWNGRGLISLPDE